MGNERTKVFAGWPPYDTVGGTVPREILIVSAERVACYVRHIVADPRGFHFQLVIRLRTANAQFLAAVQPLFAAAVPTSAKPSDFTFEVHFSDNRIFLPPMRTSDPALALRPLEGGGSAEGWAQEYRLSALPPSGGEVTFSCAWPGVGLAPTVGRIDASDILAAATRARSLWPMDSRDTT